MDTEKYTFKDDLLDLDDDEYEEDDIHLKYLTFVIGDKEYCFGIKNVAEIIGIQPITLVPNLPEYIKGVINLRGRILPVMDIRNRFKLPEIPYNDTTCVIIIRIQDITLGVIVDTVKEVVNILENQIETPHKLNKGYQSQFIKGLGKINNTIITILNAEKILYDEELSELKLNTDDNTSKEN